MLNQILRQSTVHLANGSFSALVVAVPTSRTTVVDHAGSGGEAAPCGFHVTAPAHADPLGDRAANFAVGRRR